MNYYLFAVLCMLGVIAILGFFSLIIYLSGRIMVSVKERGSGEGRRETGKEEGKREGEKKGTEMKTAATEDTEEELRKIAAIAAVTAMVDSSKSPESRTSERRRKARYPSPWMVVRE